jgi:hypothetical protein
VESAFFSGIEHALFRFRQFLRRFDAFGDGAHGPKLRHALAVSGTEIKKDA